MHTATGSTCVSNSRPSCRPPTKTTGVPKYPASRTKLLELPTAQLAAATLHEHTVQRELFATTDAAEGMSAARERRVPTFVGR